MSGHEAVGGRYHLACDAKGLECGYERERAVGEQAYVRHLEVFGKLFSSCLWNCPLLVIHLLSQISFKSPWNSSRPGRSGEVTVICFSLLILYNAWCMVHSARPCLPAVDVRECVASQNEMQV